jgi:hypothetical protein
VRTWPDGGRRRPGGLGAYYQREGRRGRPDELQHAVHAGPAIRREAPGKHGDPHPGINAADPRDELRLREQADILADVRPGILAVDRDNVGRARALRAVAGWQLPLAAPGQHGPDVLDLTQATAAEFDDTTAEQSEIAVVTMRPRPLSNRGMPGPHHTT